MADKLTFSLVSPEAELFSGEVDQVDIPGAEGDFGVLPDHSPFMAAIRTGAITVYQDGVQTKYLVQGGFADVTPDGLTVLSESATAMSELSAENLRSEIESLKASLDGLEGDAALTAQQNLSGLEQVVASL